MTTPASPEHDPKIEQLYGILKRLLDEKILSDREFQKRDHAFQEKTQKEASSLRAKNLRLTLLSVLSSVLLSLAALVAKGYAENEDRDAQALRDEQQRSAKILRDAKYKKDEIVAAISNAVSTIRKGKETAEIYCGQQISNEQRIKLKIDRIENRYKLIRERANAYFLSPEVSTLIKNFLKWDESLDYCTSPGSEEQWRQKQAEIEIAMKKSPLSLFIDAGDTD